MKIIELEPLSNGAHRNQTGSFSTVPNGWAVVPDTLDTPNFPFGTVTVDDSTPPVVTSWTAGELPEPTPEPEPEPTAEERLAALEDENKLLRAQMDMQAQQQTFLEDCLLELGDMVYA